MFIFSLNSLNVRSQVSKPCISPSGKAQPTVAMLCTQICSHQTSLQFLIGVLTSSIVVRVHRFFGFVAWQGVGQSGLAGFDRFWGSGRVSSEGSSQCVYGWSKCFACYNLSSTNRTALNLRPGITYPCDEGTWWAACFDCGENCQADLCRKNVVGVDTRDMTPTTLCIDEASMVTLPIQVALHVVLLGRQELYHGSRQGLHHQFRVGNELLLIIATTAQLHTWTPGPGVQANCLSTADERGDKSNFIIGRPVTNLVFQRLLVQCQDACSVHPCALNESTKQTHGSEWFVVPLQVIAQTKATCSPNKLLTLQSDT